MFVTRSTMNKKIKYQVHLNDDQFNELFTRRRAESNRKIILRLNAIIMKSEGMNNTSIGRILGVNINTITLWIKLFDTGGIDELCRLNYRKKEHT